MEERQTSFLDNISAKVGEERAEKQRRTKRLQAGTDRSKGAYDMCVRVVMYFIYLICRIAETWTGC